MLHPRLACEHPYFFIAGLDRYIKNLGSRWWGIKSVNQVENQLLNNAEKKTVAIFMPEAITSVLLVAAVKIEDDEIFFYFIKVKGDRYVCSNGDYFWSVDSPELTIQNILKKENAVLIDAPWFTTSLSIELELNILKEIISPYYIGIIEGDSADSNKEDLEILDRLKKMKERSLITTRRLDLIIY